MQTFRSKKPIVTINLTPLVDVSLVLVVIFMATAPMFLQNGIGVSPGEKKSASDPAPANAADDTIMVKLQNQEIQINNKFVQKAALTETLTSLLQTSRKKRVVVIPAEEVKHGEVIWVMDKANQCGAKKLVIFNPALLTSEQNTSP